MFVPQSIRDQHKGTYRSTQGFKLTSPLVDCRRCATLRCATCRKRPWQSYLASFQQRTGTLERFKRWIPVQYCPCLLDAGVRSWKAPYPQHSCAVQGEAPAPRVPPVADRAAGPQHSMADTGARCIWLQRQQCQQLRCVLFTYAVRRGACRRLQHSCSGCQGLSENCWRQPRHEALRDPLPGSLAPSRMAANAESRSGRRAGAVHAQELAVCRKAKSGPDDEAMGMVIVSQSATLRSLRMRHDAMPRRYVQTIGLLTSLTQVQVRHHPSGCHQT